MTHLSRRRVLAGAAATAAGLALAGCGSGDSSSKSKNLSKNKAGAMSRYGVGDQFKATKPITFTIMVLSNPAYPYNKNWPFFTELARRTNISLDATVVPLSDYNQKRSVMVSSGDAPMIIPKTYPPDEEQYVASGAILPVSDYLDLMPNLQDKIDKWNLAADFDTLRQDDGKFYLLPGIHQDVWVDYSLAMRTDVLRQLNLDVPKTWDEVLTTLRRMRAAHPASYPFSDRFSTPPQPGANCLFQILSQAYGTQAGWVYQNSTWDAKSKKFVVTGAMDQYKKMLQYLNTLVKEKLLDPESFTQQDDAAVQKFATGKSFVVCTNAQTLVNDLRKGIASIPGATVAKIPQPLGPLGPVKQGSRLENGIMINSKAKDSPNFVAMMQFIDWLWYSDAGQVFAKWGIEGTTYSGNVQSGTFELESGVTWAGLNPGAKKSLQVDYGFYNGVFAYGGSTKLLDTQFPAEELTFQKEMGARRTLPVPPPHPLTADEREQASLWETTLKDYVNQQSLKFALGQRSFGQWDTYVSELKGKNSGSYIDLVNKAYQRFEKKH
jgi:putative aldouronate transport system substrate-binding protein